MPLSHSLQSLMSCHVSWIVCLRLIFEYCFEEPSSYHTNPFKLASTGWRRDNKCPPFVASKRGLLWRNLWKLKWMRAVIDRNIYPPIKVGWMRHWHQFRPHIIHNISTGRAQGREQARRARGWSQNLSWWISLIKPCRETILTMRKYHKGCLKSIHIVDLLD